MSLRCNTCGSYTQEDRLLHLRPNYFLLIILNASCNLNFFINIKLCVHGEVHKNALSVVCGTSFVYIL